jgi:murein DD-endopeptidase MepM/ murein hydrolase activator NlpD
MYDRFTEELDDIDKIFGEINAHDPEPDYVFYDTIEALRAGQPLPPRKSQPKMNRWQTSVTTVLTMAASLAILFILLMVYAGLNQTALPEQTASLGIYIPTATPAPIQTINFSYTTTAQTGNGLAPTVNPSQISDIYSSTTPAPIEKPQHPYSIDPPFDQGRKSISTGRMIWPLRGMIVNYFGQYMWYGTYRGVGIRSGDPAGGHVVAADGGLVILSSWYEGYGNCVIIQHDNGLFTLYAHLSKPLIESGKYVYQGQVLGIEGSTGNATERYLHFEVRVGQNLYSNAVNPLRYLSP